MSARVYIGGAWHETHSFAADATTLADFQGHKLVEGRDLLDAFNGTATEIGGALPVFGEAGMTVVPGFFAGAMPSGVVTAPAWHEIRRRLLESVRASRPDAVFLSLHGAMVAEGEDDVEGSLLRAIRAAVGPDAPIAVTLDCHANTGPALVEAVDLLTAYDTYPHTDFAERGAEVASLLVRAMRGEVFARALVQLPIVPPVPSQATAASPMKELIALAHAAEQIPGYEVVSWMPGFPYSDVPRLGMSALVVCSAGEGAATDLASWLGRAAWSMRDRFTSSLVPVEEAVARADRAARGPVVLVDVADNIGGGSPGDGTAILAELMRRRVSGSVVSIADPEATREAVEAGAGARVSLCVGGKRDRMHGDPVLLAGTVRWCGDGAFTLKGSWMRGLTLRPGRCAWIESDAGVWVVLSERKVPPFDAGELRRVGIEPATCRVIAVKSAIAWQAAYGDLAAEAIYVDTPGICTPHLHRLPYQNRRRPLCPFDRGVDWADVRVHVFAPRRGAGAA